LFIDTHISPSVASLIREKIEEEFQRKDFAYVINTHGHSDHTLGNQVFADTVIIGHEKCVEDIKNNQSGPKRIGAMLNAAVIQMKARLEKLDPSSDAAKTLLKNLLVYELTLKGLDLGLKLTLPSLSFSDKLSLDLGDLTLNLIYFGYAHSKGDILIHCPEQGLLMTGDLFSKGNNLYIDSDRLSNLPQWIKSLELSVDPKNKIQKIIPGHFEYLDQDVLAGQLDYVKEKKVEFAGRESALYALKTVYENKGMKSAVAELQKMNSQPDKCFILHAELDQFGFRLMLKKKLDDALQLFLVLAELYAIGTYKM